MAELTRLVRAALRQHLDGQARAQSAMRPAVETPAPARRENRREVVSRAPEAPARRPAAPTVPGPLPRRPGGLPDFSVHTPWSKSDWELRRLFMALYSLVTDLGEDVQVVPSKLHIRFKRERSVVDVQLQTGKQRLLTWVRLDPGSVRLQQGFTRDVTRIGHHSPNRLEGLIASLEDLERARPLLERSYAEDV